MKTAFYTSYFRRARMSYFGFSFVSASFMHLTAKTYTRAQRRETAQEWNHSVALEMERQLTERRRRPRLLHFHALFLFRTPHKNQF